MASNVSNLLKEKIVTPVANSVAAQVDNKVKNGIILRKFIGVQLGESNTGCQLVKIDLNKINVKDPSYEFTLYIKAFSQKGLFNFIVNVNKTDSLQVDVKCEVKNSDSSNGEAIGYYDVDAVGNTITISLLKAFVVNTSINECKFVSTKDTLMISDLDIDWSDTGNVKNDTSINIKNKQTSENEYPISMLLSKNDAVENEMFKIITFDFSPLLSNKLGANDYFTIITDLSIFNTGDFRIVLQGGWSNSSEKMNLVRGYYEGIPTSVGIENKEGLFRYSTVSNTELILLMDPAYFSITNSRVIIRNIEEFLHDHIENKDFIICNPNVEKIDTSSLVIKTINKYTIDRSTIFEVSDYDGISGNGVVPHPTTSEADNKYLLGADAKWHPRKAGNEYIANLKPTEEIKGLSETDTTKGISFVTFDFNALSQKVIEAAPAPSTVQNFMIDMKVLTQDLGIITISTSLAVNPAGLIMCTGVLSDRGMGSRSVSFSTTYSGILGAVTTPGFFVNDRDTKIFKIALYTPIAIDGVKIIDAVVTSYSDIIDESDITFTWELGILEKKPYQMFISNIIYPRIDLDRELVFDQMDIETPISETDEDTLFAEQIKHNGLVPAPGKYEVDNKYLLGADAKWYPRKAGNEYIANLKPTEEILRLTETDTTKGVSFVTIDFNTLSQKIVEATPSTYQEFRLDMKVLVKELGVVDISVNFSVTKAGVIACTGVTSNRGMDTDVTSFSITFGSKIGSIPSPGFFVNDYDTKIFKLALYTVFANNGVKIIEAQITSYSDLIDENDIICTWELGVLDKLPAQIGKSNEIYLGVDLPRDQTFRQMNIETPITETEETTVEAEQLKYNGLVPAPGKYEVDNQYFLKADGTWDLPKNTVQNAIATVTPTSEMISQVEAAKTTKLISFLTIDVNEVASTIEKADRFVLSLDVLTNNFGLVRIGFNLMITATGNSNISSFSSNLGTNLLPVQLTHISNLKDYGVETMSPIFAISDTNNKGIFNIGFNGNTMKEKVIVLNMSCIPKQSTVEYKAFNYIFEPTLIDLDSSNTIRRLNSTMIGGYMDPSKIFTPISTITSEDIVSETDPYELSIEKMRNNGFVPAPAKYEADQGCILYADGTWGPIKGIIRNRTFTVTPHTDSSSTQTNDYAITEGAEDLAIAINENYSVDINIVFSGLGSKNNTNTTLRITGVTGTVNLYDYSGNPIKYITDGMSMKCTIFKNTIDDPVESMNAYCIYDIVSYPDTINGPSE